MGGYERPPPFPYKEKKYNAYYQMFDRTIDRFNENTKVLVVDGPIAAGKSTFAKELAEDLDMLYMPESNLDSVYTNSYGHDYREFNPKLPPNAQFIDVKGFYANPKHPNCGVMQLQMQMVRYTDYIEALIHLFNTGQGVVLDRSIYSDFVFMEAMHESGYLSKEVKAFYEAAYEGMKIILKQPHLVIYLDVPVNIVQKRIKERNRDWEVNSPVLNEKYLTSIEKFYKTNFLRQMSAKSEVLVYDWSNFGDVEVVVEDIEMLDFSLNYYDQRFDDWKYRKDRELSYARADYTNDKKDLINRIKPVGLFPEVMLSADEADLIEYLESTTPARKYAEGSNPEMGDSVLMKLK